MKRAISLILTGMLAANILAGCSSSDGKTETTGEKESITSSQEANRDSAGKVTVWAWTDISYLMEPYMESHPGTEIEQVVVTSGDYLTKLQTTIASGGKLPDIVWGEILSCGQLYEMDILDNLTEEPYNFDPDLIEDYILPTMKTGDGKVVGIELIQNPAGFAYRNNLAEQYFGTSDPKEVTAMFPDWETFIEIGKKVAADSDGKVMMLSSLGDVYYTINGQMEEVRIADGVIQPAVVKALFDKICEFRDAGIVGKIEQWSPAWYASFGTEDNIFSPMSNHGLADYIKPAKGDFTWSMITPPEGGFIWGGLTWGITKESDNKEAAWDFLNWCLMEAGEMRYKNNGEISSLKGFLTEEKLSFKDEHFGDQEFMRVYAEEIIPDVETKVPTVYDFADICAIEVVLSALNTDYSMDADKAVLMYINQIQEQTPDIKIAE